MIVLETQAGASAETGTAKAASARHAAVRERVTIEFIILTFALKISDFR
jgi:hypothetical protein